MPKDDLTLAWEEEQGETKQESAVERLDPLIERYRRDCGGTDEEMQTVLTDLLADLMHWASAQADEEEVDFETALDSGRMHYDREHDDEDEGEDVVCGTCHRPLRTDCGVWVDDTGGDVCMDNDGNDGAHQPSSDDNED